MPAVCCAPGQKEPFTEQFLNWGKVGHQRVRPEKWVGEDSVIVHVCAREASLHVPQSKGQGSGLQAVHRHKTHQLDVHLCVLI